jgi:hypothetical protein
MKSATSSASITPLLLMFDVAEDVSQYQEDQ